MATYKTWGILGPLFGEQSEEDKLAEEAKKNRPVYKKNPIYDQNIALAKEQAFGRNPVFALKDQQIAQQGAEDLYQGQKVSDSSGSILNLLAQINNSKVQGLQNNALAEGQFKTQALDTVMAANIAGAEEDDKVWNQNVLDPYNKDIQFKRDMLKQEQEMRQKTLDSILSLGTMGISAATGGFGNTFRGGGGYKSNTYALGDSVGWNN